MKKILATPEDFKRQRLEDWISYIVFAVVVLSIGAIIAFQEYL